VLQAQDGDYYHFKTDVFSGMITYSSDRHNASNLVTIPKERVFEIIAMNKKGKKPLKLESDSPDTQSKQSSFTNDLLADQSITRFDRETGRKPVKRKKRNKRDNSLSSESQNGQDSSPDEK
jgi:hypothetical protein